MKKYTLLTGVFALVFGLSCTAFGAASEWFDANIADQSAWPSTVARTGGDWVGTSDQLSALATWDSDLTAIALDTTATQQLVFAATDSKSAASTELVISSTIDFTLTPSDTMTNESGAVTLPIPAQAKAGLTVVTNYDDDAAIEWWGLAKAGDNSSNTWTRLYYKAAEASSFAPSAAAVKITINNGESPYAIYKVNDKLLYTTSACTDDGKVTIYPYDNVVSNVMYSGLGKIKSLASTSEPISYFPQSGRSEDGSAANPFVIRDGSEGVTDLNNMKKGLANGTITTQHFKLYDGITLTAWEGIGTEETPFKGTFDGNGKRIFITFKTGVNYNGLFRFIKDAAISNATVQANGFSTEPTDETGAAAFVGRANGTCYLENLTAKGDIGTTAYPATHNAAGLVVAVGKNSTDGRIIFTHCTNKVNVVGNYTKTAGFLALIEDFYGGSIVNYAKFVGCSNEGTIKNLHSGSGKSVGDGACGGLLAYGDVGNASKTLPAGTYTFIDCSSTGLVTSTFFHAGTFIGYGQSGSIQISGTSVGHANIPANGKEEATAGVNYATVVGDVATFVDSFSLSKTYKLMAKNLTPSFNFTSSGTIAFNTNLFEAAAWTGITAGSRITVTSNAVDGVVTFTATKLPFSGGTGTEADPYQIASYADLVDLQSMVTAGTSTEGVYFEQTADIDFADIDGEGTKAAPWDGIGDLEPSRTMPVSAGEKVFQGFYDGQGHVINNVILGQHEYHGFFNSIKGGALVNLTIDIDGIAATSGFGAAAFCGWAIDSVFTNLLSTGTIISTNGTTTCTHSCAGIAVRFEGSTAYACTNRATISTKKEKLGGIAAIGQSTKRDYFILCSNEGTLDSQCTDAITTGGIGGIFGYPAPDYTQPSTFRDCSSSGKIFYKNAAENADRVGSYVGLREEAPVFEGTNIAPTGMPVVASHDVTDSPGYGEDIGNGLVKLVNSTSAFIAGKTYHTMKAGQSLSFTFTEAGTIAFNTNFHAAAAFNVTGSGRVSVTSTNAVGGVVTFTATKLPFSGGSGTAADPYQLATASDFADLKNGLSTYKSAYFKLTDNVTLGNDATGWVGIGTKKSYTDAFMGVFNGNGKTITVTFADETTYNGIFCSVNGATVSNLTVHVAGFKGVSVETGAAGIAGCVYGSTTFERLRVTGSLGSSDDYLTHMAAGIAVRVFENVSGLPKFIACTNDADVYAKCSLATTSKVDQNNTKAGGMLACADIGVSFVGCVNNGDITADVVSHGTWDFVRGVGGILGYANGGASTVTNCVNTGTLTDNDGVRCQQVGQFCGGDNGASMTGVGTNVGLANVKPIGENEGSTNVSPNASFTFATVDGDKATFVASPATAITGTVEYKAMIADNSSFHFTLAAADASLTIVTNMFGFSGTATSGVENYRVKSVATSTGVTYTLEPAEFTVKFTAGTGVATLSATVGDTEKSCSAGGSVTFESISPNTSYSWTVTAQDGYEGTLSGSGTAQAEIDQTINLTETQYTYTFAKGTPTGTVTDFAMDTITKGGASFTAPITLDPPTYTSTDTAFAGWSFGGKLYTEIPVKFANCTFTATWKAVMTVSGIDVGSTSGASIKLDSAAAARLGSTPNTINDGSKNKKWVDEVIGNTSGDAITIESVVTNADTIVVKPSFDLPKYDTGATVELTLTKSDESTVVKSYDGTFKLDTTGEDVSGKYTLTTKVTVKGSDGQETPLTTSQLLGVLKVDSTATRTIVAVPWTQLGADSNITADKLVQTGNLTAGDELQVYNGTNYYYTYTLKADKTWQAPTKAYVIGSDGKPTATEIAVPSSLAIKRGAGVWLIRQNTSKPVYLMGGADNSSSYAASEIVAPSVESDTNRVWNLVAPTSLAAINLNDRFAGISNKTRFVVPGTNGVNKIFTKDATSGKWGCSTREYKDVTGKGKMRWVYGRSEADTDCTIPKGTGFYYNNGEKDKTSISW